MPGQMQESKPVVGKKISIGPAKDDIRHSRLGMQEMRVVLQMVRLFGAALFACMLASTAAGAQSKPLANEGEWLDAVSAKLATHKTYPKGATSAHSRTATLRLVISREGNIIEATVQKSSGDTALDAVVLEMARKAESFPPFAADMSEERRVLLVPVRFNPPAGDEALAPERSFADSDTGLRLAVPEPFRIVDSGSNPGSTIIVQISSSTNIPPKSASADVLCSVGLGPVPAELEATQDDFNDLTILETIIASLRTGYAELGIVEKADMIEMGGLRGVEFVLAPKMGVDRKYIAIFETPRGRITTECDTSETSLDLVVAGFRPLVGGIGFER
jgi:protein TonB